VLAGVSLFLPGRGLMCRMPGPAPKAWGCAPTWAWPNARAAGHLLVAVGLTGLGVPFVLAIGLWLLAVASTVTFVQRVLVVRKAVGPGAAPQPAAQPAAAPAGPAGAVAPRQARAPA